VNAADVLIVGAGPIGPALQTEHPQQRGTSDLIDSP
jgi:hypothetical protein